MAKDFLTVLLTDFGHVNFQFSEFTVRMQVRAEHCYVNVTLKTLNQKEAILFIQFYWDVCLFKNMNFTYVHPG